MFVFVNISVYSHILLTNKYMGKQLNSDGILVQFKFLRAPKQSPVRSANHVYTNIDRIVDCRE